MLTNLLMLLTLYNIAVDYFVDTNKHLLQVYIMKECVVIDIDKLIDAKTLHSIAIDYFVDTNKHLLQVYIMKEYVVIDINKLIDTIDTIQYCCQQFCQCQ